MDLYDTRRDVLPHLLKVNPKANQFGDLHYSTTIDNKELEITLYNVESKHTIEVKQIVEDSVEEMYHMQGGDMAELGIELTDYQWKIIKNVFFSTTLELNQSMEVGRGNW
jgi:hypothetical protein